MAEYDGKQNDLALYLAPPGCDRDTCLRAFALLAGAAAANAARLGDGVEFGDQPEEERQRWNALACVLMQAADEATPDGWQHGRRERDLIAALVAALETTP